MFKRGLSWCLTRCAMQSHTCWNVVTGHWMPSCVSRLKEVGCALRVVCLHLSKLATMATNEAPEAAPARRSKWAVAGRAPVEIPVDPWKPDALQKLKAELVSEGHKRQVDLNLDPRALLDEPDLCKMLWPGVDKFFQSDEDLQQDVRQFVSELMAKGSEWRFQDALKFVKKHGVTETTELHMQPVIKFLANCVCMDPINIDQAINVLFSYLTNNDHRICCGSMQLRDDMPTIFIAGSGGGKSPMIIKTMLERIVMKVQNIVERIPGGFSSFITAGTSYPGWLTAVVRLVYRTCFLWEELFFGINKSKASSKSDKMSLEENIRCYNPMAVGGDLRATVDRQLQADTKCSVMAGLQYKSFHEYLAGDTKGALERFHFCLSDVLTPKNTPQENRLSDQKESTSQVIKMLDHHVEHMFPAEVMEQYKANLCEAAGEKGGDETEAVEAGAADEGQEAADDESNEAGRAGRRRRLAPTPRAKGQAAAKKAKTNEVAPKKKHVVMPPSGVKTTLDADSEDFFTKACNYYRGALPDEYANHAFFASAMKIDQTLARFVATRARRREAFLKTVFGESWRMADTSHPVDLPMAEAFLRCDLATRFAVYNELVHRDAVAAQSSTTKPAEEGDDAIPSGGKPTPGQQGEFEKVLRKIVQKAEQVDSGQIDFHADFLRYGEYKGVEGWCKFIAQAHGHQLIDQIFNQEKKGMVAAVEAILDGQVGTAKKKGKVTGPSFILNSGKVASWLNAEGATQPAQAEAGP